MSTEFKRETCSVCQGSWPEAHSFLTAIREASGVNLSYWCPNCKKWICLACSKKTRSGAATVGRCPDCNTILKETKTLCFVASAAFQNEPSWQIKVLYDFRDHILQNSRIGRAFIKSYYHFSPPVADYIGKTALARWTVRLLVITPVAALLVLLSKVIYRNSTEEKTLGDRS